MRKQESLRDLQQVPWQEFERLVCAYYQEAGWAAVRTGSDGPDGGIDVVLRKDGKRVLVQCKKYVREQVGVAAVREFFGVVVAEGASGGIFITTSTFTAEAMAFGLRQVSLELIPGERFAQMVANLNKRPPGENRALPPAETAAPSASSAPAPPVEAPCCPKCSRRMVTRRARSGPSPGSEFWGCLGYPECKGTRSMAG